MAVEKHQIISAARGLFMEKGYDAVTMREIAKEMGISVGNLTYHFPRKEAILMAIHDQIMDSYQSQLSSEWKRKMGLAGYFASEYAFHSFIVNDSAFYRIYIQVINSPSMRVDYYNRHLSLYQSFVDDPDPQDLLYDATVVTSSLEFQLMESGMMAEHFDDTFRKIFRARLIFLNLDIRNYEDVIEEGIREGKSLSQRIKVSFGG